MDTSLWLIVAGFIAGWMFIIFFLPGIIKAWHKRNDAKLDAEIKPVAIETEMKVEAEPEKSEYEKAKDILIDFVCKVPLDKWMVCAEKKQKVYSLYMALSDDPNNLKIYIDADRGLGWRQSILIEGCVEIYDNDELQLSKYLKSVKRYLYDKDEEMRLQKMHATIDTLKKIF